MSFISVIRPDKHLNVNLTVNVKVFNTTKKSHFWFRESDKRYVCLTLDWGESSATPALLWIFFPHCDLPPMWRNVSSVTQFYQRGGAMIKCFGFFDASVIISKSLLLQKTASSEFIFSALGAFCYSWLMVIIKQPIICSKGIYFYHLVSRSLNLNGCDETGLTRHHPVLWPKLKRQWPRIETGRLLCNSFSFKKCTLQP